VWFKARAWIVVAWLLCLANLVAVWFAAQPAEPWHATGHALLAVLFGLGAQRLGSRKRSTTGADVVTRQELEARLPRSDPQEVAKALDAIAVEVERIGEGQRYLTKLLTARDARSPDAIRAPAKPELPG
jgi:hypothetical protein